MEFAPLQSRGDLVDERDVALEKLPRNVRERTSNVDFHALDRSPYIGHQELQSRQLLGDFIDELSG
jgi:hypothetical protein